MESNKQLALDILCDMFPAVQARWLEVKERLERNDIGESYDDLMRLSSTTRENLGWNVQEIINRDKRSMYAGILSYYAHAEMYDAFNMPLIRGGWSYKPILTRFKRVQKLYDNKLSRKFKSLVKKIEV